MPKRLTKDLIDHYWREGYAVAQGLFEVAEIDAWRARVRALASRKQPPSPNMVLVRDVMFAKGAAAPETPEHEICKINFWEHEPVLRRYGDHPRLLDAVEDLLGPDVLFVNSMCVTKPPGVDGRHPLHQDLLYFGFRPGDAMVGTWTALDPVTRANGCLSVLPGSHRGALLPHALPDWDYVNAAFVGAEGIDASERVHVEMAPGDALLFHPLLLHGSGTNRTKDFRRAISSHYAQTHADDLWSGKDRISTRPFIPVRGEGARPI